MAVKSLSSKDWLDMPVADGSGKNVLQIFASLVCKNGGKMSLDHNMLGAFIEGGPYGHYGLDIQEACQLQYLLGMADGFMLAEGGVNRTHLMDALTKEVLRAATEAGVKMEN